MAPVCASGLSMPIFVKTVETLNSATPTAPGTKLMIVKRAVNETTEPACKKSMLIETLLSAIFQPATTVSHEKIVNNKAVRSAPFCRRFSTISALRRFSRSEGNKKTSPIAETPPSARTAVSP
jgi:hypothetical protein